MEKLNLNYKNNRNFIEIQKKTYLNYRNHPILLEYLKQYPKTNEEIYQNIFKIKQMIENQLQQKLSNSETYEFLDENFEVIYISKQPKHLLQENYMLYDVAKVLLDANLNKIIETEKEQYHKLITLLFNAYTANKGFYLYGKMGVGKTYLMHAFINQLIKKYNMNVIAVRSNDMMRDFKLCNNRDELQNRLQKFYTIPILLIDDIGSETVDTFERDEILFSILDERMRNQKPTYFTSNLGLDALCDHLSEGKYKIEDDKATRVLERIKAMCEVRKLEGENRRY